MSTVLSGLWRAVSSRTRSSNTLSTAHRSARKLDLPLEMALKILESAERLNDVIALALTAPVFNAVWITYTGDILAAVVPRSIECYAEALELYNTFQGLRHSEDEGTVKRSRRLLSAARIAASVRDHLCRKCHSAKNGQQGDTMTSRELRCFISGFYHIWKVVLIACFGDSDTGLPSNPDLPDHEDIIPVGEITIMAQLSDARLGVLIRKTYGIYTPHDHMRYATYQRWRNCCVALWRNDDFFQRRHHFWGQTLLIREEPYIPEEDEDCAEYSALYLEFLSEARRKLYKASEEYRTT